VTQLSQVKYMNTPYSQNSRWFNLKTLSLVIVVVLVGSVSVVVNLANRTPDIVHTSSSMTVTDQHRGKIGTVGSELYPTISRAGEEFDELLESSKGYQEFTPCFDDRGKLIGKRAIMWMHSPPPTKAYWKIVWTEQRSDHSKLYYTESDSLDNARELENKIKTEWRACRTTN